MLDARQTKSADEIAPAEHRRRHGGRVYQEITDALKRAAENRSALANSAVALARRRGSVNASR